MNIKTNYMPKLSSRAKLLKKLIKELKSRKKIKKNKKRSYREVISAVAEKQLPDKIRRMNERNGLQTMYLYQHKKWDPENSYQEYLDSMEKNRQQLASPKNIPAPINIPLALPQNNNKGGVFRINTDNHKGKTPLTNIKKENVIKTNPISKVVKDIKPIINTPPKKLNINPLLSTKSTKNIVYQPPPPPSPPPIQNNIEEDDSDNILNEASLDINYDEDETDWGEDGMVKTLENQGKSKEYISSLLNAYLNRIIVVINDTRLKLRPLLKNVIKNHLLRYETAEYVLNFLNRHFKNTYGNDAIIEFENFPYNIFPKGRHLSAPNTILKGPLKSDPLKPTNSDTNLSEQPIIIPNTPVSKQPTKPRVYSAPISKRVSKLTPNTPKPVSKPISNTVSKPSRFEFTDTNSNPKSKPKPKPKSKYVNWE